MIKRVIVLVLLALLVVVGVVLAFDGSIDSSVISSGGGRTQNGPFSIQASIGQPVAGITSGIQYEIQAGFWNGSIPGYSIFLPNVLK
jgi:asparagine N-glycosylation enzyme membrane subunit Stt3